MVCTSLGSLLRPLFYFLFYIHFSLSVVNACTIFTRPLMLLRLELHRFRFQKNHFSDSTVSTIYLEVESEIYQKRNQFPILTILHFMNQSQVFQSQTILQTIRSLKKLQKMSSLKNPKMERSFERSFNRENIV